MRRSRMKTAVTRRSTSLTHRSKGRRDDSNPCTHPTCAKKKWEKERGGKKIEEGILSKNSGGGGGGREKKRRKEKKRITKRAMIGRRDGKRGRGKKTVARTAGWVWSAFHDWLAITASIDVSAPPVSIVDSAPWASRDDDSEKVETPDDPPPIVDHAARYQDRRVTICFSSRQAGWGESAPTPRIFLLRYPTLTRFCRRSSTDAVFLRFRYFLLDFIKLIFE